MTRNYMWRWLVSGLLALFFFVVPMITQAQEFIPVEQIKPGMMGIAKTVVAGTEISEFNVEVLGIMKQKGPSGDLILVRVSGPAVDETGIAEGMSGSPVYFDGKLAGAIAYGWSLTDHKIGMVTPIADMLRIWNIPAMAEPEKVLPPQEANVGQNVKAGSESKQPPLKENPEADKKPVPDLPEQNGEPVRPVPFPGDKKSPVIPAGKLRPLSTPLMAAGLSDRALEMLTEQLKPYNLTPYDTGGFGGADYEKKSSELKPGSAMGVELVRGDFSLGAIGTVTYVEGNRVLAFGHPFMKKGRTNLFMNSASVLTVLNGVQNSIKIGALIDPVGMVEQDRGAGISGTLGKFPVIIPMRMHITDEDTDNARDVAVQIVQDEQLSPILGAVSLFNSVEKIIDRKGAGTARVRFTITGAPLPGGVLERDNMFYSPTDIDMLLISEVHEAMNLLASNPFEPVQIMDVAIKVDVSNDRKTAAIQGAAPAQVKVKPGDIAQIKVTLRPYRGQPFIKAVPFQVPKGQKPGPLTVSVHGGGYTTPGLMVQDQMQAAKQKGKNKSLAEEIKKFTERDRNNDIIVEIMDYDLDAMLREALGSGKDKKEPQEDNKPLPPPLKKTTELAPPISDEKPLPVPGEPSMKKKIQAMKQRRKSHVTTDYIVEGGTQVVLQVVEK